MSTTDDIEEARAEIDLRPRGLAATLFRGSREPRYRRVVWAFLFGSFTHLWLADTWQPDWLLPDLVYVAGLVILLVSGGAAGWLSSAAGLLWPLLFLRDQLTQSVVLLAFSFAGAAAMMWEVRRPAPVGGAGGSPAVGAFLGTCRWITVATYGLATLHKVNREFLDPAYSCAVYGIDKLATHWSIDPALVPTSLDPAIPWFALLLEGSIPLAYLLGRRRIAWLLTVIFHIPLTITMAPAFAFVMAVGHVAWMTEEDRDALVAAARRHGLWIAPLAAVITAASVGAQKGWPEPTMIPKEWMLWAALFALLAAFPPWRRAAWAAGARVVRGPIGRALVVGAVALFTLNGLSPYLGVQFQHSAAMLSNLRIDRGCWNSYVFPESARLTDDYVRIDTAYFGRPGRIPDYEAIVLEQLWSPPQIRQMRRNWCSERTRPIYLRGSFRGRVVEIADLCDGAPLPFGDDGIFGVELFGDFLRYQKNLMRACPQTCVH